MSCVFCDIVAKKIPACFVLEADAFVAFLDTRPVFVGHTLLVPREHVETLAELPLPLAPALVDSTQRIMRAVEAALGADGTFVATNSKVSQSVAHFHVHVVPRKKKDGLRGFFWPRQKYESDAQMRETADAIRRAIS